MVIAFNTLNFANKLKEAGMSPALADVQSEETAKILNDLTQNQLVAKQDLKDLEMKLYGFMVKTAMFTVCILGGLQTLFHFVE